MKAKKGFTLIELLAVIVILAVIALIATPMIMGVIDEAREGAARSSAYAYIHAVENEIAIQLTLNPSANIDSVVSDLKITPDTSLVKSSAPTSVSLVIDSTGTVKDGSVIKVSNYTFTMTNGELK